ncbi:uncharacterized protein N7469_005026 [Penicillium citrinum]|uniref:Uncharacterized protein n=2 Tax=Penicillium TaxID=5073 RepID=A0A9W9TNP3_PENCI|nr:uncharacterized protein N7469_005026 [Penicillium citrinum]KAJ5233260.1 hypothetical protein N7469_005026 [Penicillium citrinum]KAJ5573277.1 hypothetical protein N7450_010261 [Penicillium hetheringtonii]
MPQVSELFGIPILTLQGLYSRAKQRGFDPSHHPLEVLGQFIADAPHSGRPRKQPETIEDNVSTEPQEHSDIRNDNRASIGEIGSSKDQAESEILVDAQDES